jgi:subtilisin family serine protease
MLKQRLRQKLFAAFFLLLIILTSSCGPRASEDAAEKPRRVDKNALWHLFGKNGINIEPAWALTKGNENLTLAVIDDHFFLSSLAFSGCPNKYYLKQLVSSTPKEKSHGTAVASLLSTCSNNPWGLMGVNVNSPIIFLPIDRIYEYWVLGSLRWALGGSGCTSKQQIGCKNPISKPVDIINMSFGFGDKVDDFEKLKPMAFHLLRLSREAANIGTILIAAAGNQSQSADHSFPHSLSGVISAGATTKDGVAASLSNWGETVDIMAPGKDITVAQERSLVVAKGTSLSAPIISGVVSLMKSVYPDLNWKTAIYFLQSTAVPMDCDAYCIGRKACEQDCCIGNTQFCTPGRVDAGAAVLAAKNATTAGLPKVALVDADHFAIELVPSGIGVTGTFKIYNMGGSGGRYLLSTNNPLVQVSPNTVDLDEKGGVHDTETITLHSNNPNPGWTDIKIRSPQAGKQAGFTDEMVVSAQRLNPK